MFLRYYILIALLSILLVWPIKFLVSFYFRRKRILQMMKGIEFVEDFPGIGIGQRFIGKDSSGWIFVKWIKTPE